MIRTMRYDIVAGEELKKILSSSLDNPIPFNEDLSRGTYSKPLFDDAFLKQRAAFHQVSEEVYCEKLSDFLKLLKEAKAEDEVHLYFGEDNVCLANRKAAIKALKDKVGTIVLHIVNEYTGEEIKGPIVVAKKGAPTFRHFGITDYEAVCDFLIEINENGHRHINWNWARFEWMYEHPEFDKSLQNAIGLWENDGKIVALATYDMYFGEGFVATLPEYDFLFEEALEYAYQNLKDENGFGLALGEDDALGIKAVEDLGYEKADQRESMMAFDLNKPMEVSLPEGYAIDEPDFDENYDEVSFTIYQGFGHGDDFEEFRKDQGPRMNKRVHLNPKLSLAVRDFEGKMVAYCCLWYSPKTDYAYLEPLCVIPSVRGKGIAKALVYEGLRRVKDMGAKKVYVISDMPFYTKLGFEKEGNYIFYFKR